MITGAIMQKINDDECGKIIELPDLNAPEIRKRNEEKMSEIMGEKNSCDITEKDITPPTYFLKYKISEQGAWNGVRDNEDGDSQLYVAVFKNKLLYDHATDTWYYWNEHYWREDVLKHRYRNVADIQEIYNEQKERELYKAEFYRKLKKEDKATFHDALAEKYHKRIELLQTQYRKNNVLIGATQGKDMLGISGEEWDRKPHLIGVKNGIIDLLSGEFDDSGTRQQDYIKTIAPTIWKGIDEPCPEWEKFLNQTFTGRPEIVRFLQTLLGYSLRGDTPEHIFPIFYGAEGRNGKGTIFETLKYVLGNLAYKAPSEFLMTKTNSQQSADAPSATLMKLRGTRLVWCSETNEGDRIDAAKLKELVGGDTISARSPYGKRQIEFQPTHTLFTMTNAKPRMPANDPALWRRIFLISFDMTFVDNPDPKKTNQIKADKNLKDKLRAEGAGILAWLVRGAIHYEQTGLIPPDEVIEATKGYREEEDIIGHFVDEYCEIGDPESRFYRTRSKELYEGYKEWCKEAGHFPMAKNKFRNNLLTKFEERRDGIESARKFFGIALKSSFSSYR